MLPLTSTRIVNTRHHGCTPRHSNSCRRRVHPTHDEAALTASPDFRICMSAEVWACFVCMARYWFFQVAAVATSTYSVRDQRHPGWVVASASTSPTCGRRLPTGSRLCKAWRYYPMVVWRTLPVMGTGTSTPVRRLVLVIPAIPGSSAVRGMNTPEPPSLRISLARPQRFISLKPRQLAQGDPCGVKASELPNSRPGRCSCAVSG